MLTGWKVPNFRDMLGQRPTLDALTSLERHLAVVVTGGTTTATTDGSGDVTIPLDFANEARWGVVNVLDTTARYATVVSLSRAAMVVRVFDSGGSAVTATSVTLTWSAGGR